MDNVKNYRKQWLTVKSIIVGVLLCMSGGATVQASQSMLEQTNVTIYISDATLNEVLWELQKQTSFKFIYNTNEARKVKISHFRAKNENVSEVLNRCLKNSGLTYSEYNGVIAIKAIHKAGAMKVADRNDKINGVVLDENGQTVIGANVVVKGTTIGTSTDMDGHFSIDTPSNHPILEISYIGYAKQEIKAVAGKSMKIVLVPDNNVMDEIIVTGYGSFKKSAYAGSASNVKAEKMKDIPVVSFMDMIQGNAPGVQFSSSSGQPGASSSLNIRGMGSFNASNSPLYVIDGVPVRSGSINSQSSDAGLDIMSTINSSDIESITVIKDAAAASLYGSRAANGVVVITTKKGKSGKPVVEVKADWGKSDFAMDYRPVMNGEQRRSYLYNGLYMKSLRDGSSEADATAYADENIDTYAPIPWCGFVDWDDIMFKKGNHQNYEASISGGTDKFKFYSSVAYLKQDGISLNSGLERLTGRLNVDYQATKKLAIGANILFATVTQDVYSEGTSYTSPFYSSRNCVVPSDAVYNEDGSWNRDFIRNDDRNPLLAATYDYQKEYVNRSFNTIYGTYELLKDLKLKSTFSYDYTITKGKDWSDPRTSNGDDVNGGMDKSFYEFKKMVWANQLTYKFAINNHHHFDLLAGYEIDETYRDYLSGYATNFATPDKNDISNGMKTESVSGSDTKSRLVSYLTRVNYDYKNKYYLGGSYRVDGSSRLESDSRWGSFWSVSAAWRMIEEKFMDPVRDILTDLKLRASYGVNGTLPSDYYGYMGLSSLTNGYLEQPGIIQSQLKNSDLKWETNYNLNIGLDFSLFNRVNFTVEYYTRNTKNLLMDRPISMTTGFNSYLMNIGKVKNEGVELEINSTNFATKDFKWNTTFSISHNKNKIVVLDGMQDEIISGTQIRKVGKSYRTFYMIEFAGINPENGNPQFYTNDLDEKGNYIKDITEDPSKANAIVTNKHAEPNIIGGLSNRLSYKWFDLSFLFSYQFGGYSYDTWAQKTEHGGNDMNANIPTYYLDSWQKEGDITNYELILAKRTTAMSKYATTRRLHSSDFIRLKNITLGVTVPKRWIRKTGINNLRLYASASNLWTWASYDYYDPEAVSGGTAIWGTPPLKTVTFGVNFNL